MSVLNSLTTMKFGQPNEQIPVQSQYQRPWACPYGFIADIENVFAHEAVISTFDFPRTLTASGRINLFNDPDSFQIRPKKYPCYQLPDPP